MPEPATGRIRIGIGGWVFPEWRGSFYPKGLPQKEELSYASSCLTSIEINGTFYGSQKPESFARWHDETPEDFVFTLKGPRFATNRRELREAGSSVERFLSSGVLELKKKLGPINWQLAPNKQFLAEDIAAFFALLPKTVEGRAIRHAIEVRHESFRTPEFVAIAREHGVAIITAGDSDYPQITDLTAPFSYLRIMGTEPTHPKGYAAPALKAWAERVKALAAGEAPPGLARPLAKAEAAKPRDVFLYVISGAKAHNPAAALALIDLLSKR